MDYAAAWRKHGFPYTVIPMPGCHHFAVMPELMKPDSRLTKAVLEQLGLRR
jgi:hypothetical protein